MHNTKVCTCLALVFAVFLVSFVSYVSASDVTLQDENNMRNIADEINQNSSLPVTLLAPYQNIKNELRRESIDYIDNYMSFDFYFENYTLIFEGFPTDEDEFFLTEITLSGGTYNILGIHILDEMEQAKNALKEKGFHQLDSNNPLQYIKENVIIELEGTNVVEAITVEFPSAYTSGNLY